MSLDDVDGVTARLARSPQSSNVPLTVGRSEADRCSSVAGYRRENATAQWDPPLPSTYNRTPTTTNTSITTSTVRTQWRRNCVPEVIVT
jgi:hypothetical protein